MASAETQFLLDLQPKLKNINEVNYWIIHMV